MEEIDIKSTLKEFHGTTEYHKHLFPGKSPNTDYRWLQICQGCL